MINKTDIDNAFCGMDIYEKYGWVTPAHRMLATAIMLGGSCLEETINDMKKSNRKLSSSTKIVDENGEYLSEYVFMVEFEVALNWLLWATYEKSAGDKYMERCSKLLNQAWQEQRNYNLTQCDKNKEFSHFHFVMTD